VAPTALDTDFGKAVDVAEAEHLLEAEFD